VKENTYLVQSVIKDGAEGLVLAGEMNVNTINFIVRKQLDVILPYNDINQTDFKRLVFEGMLQAMKN